ncbi:MAG: IS1595 family transposase [Nitrospirae bacterium]|nr:IS1595 family transposase [Nitrospirota bacterium]
MEDYPETVLDFEQRFSSEEACYQYLYQLRWQDGFICPKCGYNKAWNTKRGSFRCQKCDHQVSITAGTIFQDTRKPLQLWFRAMWYLVNQKHGVSALGIQRVLGLKSYETAWIWLHKLRKAMVRPDRDCLSGSVEVVEIYIGGEKSGKRGRGAAGKSLVMIAAEKNSKSVGRIRLCRVPDASANSLTPAIQQSITIGSTVFTDAWSGYTRLEEIGYEHTVVRKSAEVGDNLLPLANRVASLLKRWLIGTHQGAVRASHLDFYLDEFTFRFNRRTSRSRGKLFYRLAQQAVAIQPITGDEIKCRICTNQSLLGE